MIPHKTGLSEPFKKLEVSSITNQIFNATIMAADNQAPNLVQGPMAKTPMVALSET